MIVVVETFHSAIGYVEVVVIPYFLPEHEELQDDTSIGICRGVETSSCLVSPVARARPEPANSGGGIDGTKSAAARNMVVSVMTRTPSMSMATSTKVYPRQRLTRGDEFICNGNKSSFSHRPAIWK